MISSISAIAASALCTTKNQNYLYAKPNGKSSVTWVVGKNMPLRKLEVKGSWIQVADLEGEKHWIPYTNVSSRGSCLVVSRRKTILRTGPGKDFPVAEAPTAERYSPYRDLAGEDGWTQVVDDFGNAGWVNLDHTWKPTDNFRMDFDR